MQRMPIILCHLQEILMVSCIQMNAAIRQGATKGKRIMKPAFTKIIDQYQNLRSDREAIARLFLDGTRPYMIFQTLEGNVWGNVRGAQECFKNNIEYISSSLEVPSDHLPVMEPWFGTGVYANMYGCPYVWRDILK